MVNAIVIIIVIVIIIEIVTSLTFKAQFRRQDLHSCLTTAPPGPDVLLPSWEPQSTNCILIWSWDPSLP